LLSVHPVPDARPSPEKPGGQVQVKVEPPVGLHVAPITQSSVFATHASVTEHVRVLLHGSPVCVVPAGHVQL
jgi:hypothetical protein